MVTVVLGWPGRLATALTSVLETPVVLGRADFDLTNPSALKRALEAHNPDTIINCAAYNAVDAAEHDQTTAFAVNAVAVGTLAEVAAEMGSHLVTFSTDYVFDGLKSSPYVESDRPAPLNEYGRSKLAGEQLALAYENALVVRTAWLTSKSHPGFVESYLGQARNGPFYVVDDQRGRPTVASHLAAAIRDACERRLTGLIHLASGGAIVSRHQLAQHVLAAAELDPLLAIPCASDRFPDAARRPAMSALGSERVPPAIRLGEWESAVTDIARSVEAQLHRR